MTTRVPTGGESTWPRRSPAVTSRANRMSHCPPNQSDAGLMRVLRGGQGEPSDANPLDFVERNLVAGAVIELGGLGRLVGGNLLGLLDGAAGFEVGGDAGGPERVAADPRREPGGGGPPLYHVQGVVAAERRPIEGPGLPVGRPEERPLWVACDACRLDVGIQVGFRVVVGGHLVELAALLVEAEPPPLAVGVVVLDLH